MYIERGITIRKDNHNNLNLSAKGMTNNSVLFLVEEVSEAPAGSRGEAGGWERH